MTYHLAIGDRMYSSWSLRGWLLFAAFDIPAETQPLQMYTPEFTKSLKAYGIANTVPAMRVEGDGATRVVWDSLAIAETLHEENPKAGLWPENASDRAMARTLAAEMHSGFNDLREHCRMTLISAFKGFEAPEGVQKDIARIQDLWAYARENRSMDGPWLFGDYSAADVFFAPVAARIAAFQLDVDPPAAAYMDAHLNHTCFRQWRARAFAAKRRLDVNQVELPAAPWPGPKPLPARAVSTGTPINDVCPYSGDPVSMDSLAEFDGTIVGFCKPFCRDKSVVDPAAWPKLMALLQN